VLRLGCGNSQSSDWAASGNWKSLDFLNLIKTTSPQHLWIIQLGANDVISSVPVATYITNIQTLITNLKASSTNVQGGDVVLMTTPPLNGVSLANNLLYRQAVYDLAKNNDLLVIDNYSDFVSFANGNANGWYSSANTVHQSALGYIEVVNNMFNSGTIL
jgi:lysophospholipase L1-like esterase